MIFALGPELKPAFVFAVAAKTTTPSFAEGKLRFQARVCETFAKSQLRGYMSILKERGRNFFGGLMGRAKLSASFFDDSRAGFYSSYAQNEHRAPHGEALHD